jgi:hypothetical protein
VIRASTTRVRGQLREDGSVLASSSFWQYGHGKVVIMATAMMHVQALEHVYEVASVEVSMHAQRERERRTDATGRGRALACPEWCRCTLWHGLGVLGASSLGQCCACFELVRVQACVG